MCSLRKAGKYARRMSASSRAGFGWGAEIAMGAVMKSTWFYLKILQHLFSLFLAVLLDHLLPKGRLPDPLLIFFGHPLILFRSRCLTTSNIMHSIFIYPCRIWNTYIGLVSICLISFDFLYYIRRNRSPGFFEYLKKVRAFAGGFGYVILHDSNPDLSESHHYPRRHCLYPEGNRRIPCRRPHGHLP